ncbi:MAG: bifunctional (p)ppGpp synthetase/guanosine-3',5'-bis(diphosphate) 3'-pyrophosphohydrolase [Leptolyngbyaceae cyanobacterium RU_5_1]|nr:bifunctional (p)ppGpp synthetase/guanosine-3',5'-bis(diphosphate) 3'-pyrophosphohydrolase [Leptolyngbyaceae cyanobacterium RU_5_1]
MNLTASASSTEFAVPDWLRECLNTRRVAPDGSELQAPRADADLIYRAFEFAYLLHQGQYRASGEPYIAHPVAVAGLLRDLGGGSVMIAAGFLHDVVEDTEVALEELEELFGEEVRILVEGVTKLSKFNFSSKTERQAENFRRMFLAMAQDIRVIVVKLADRLHNMRTLEHLPDAKRRRIAMETREIFAPLANRLGIGRFKWELEDLSFKYLEPDAYRGIQELVAEKRTDREARLANIAESLRNRLEQVGVQTVDVSGRPKHLYGIYQKMQRQQKGYEEIYDVAAVRIIVQTNEECYRALAIVHDMFRPIPGRFKDYIGLPKPNRYQSLHTIVIGNTGKPLEIQIRTLEMHHIAEYGIAAHWKYKETGGSSNVQMTTADEKFTWLRQLLDWQNDLKDAQEYLESIKDDLFDGEVYVFTPQGDVVSLSRGATSIDFAYRIHTEVGNHCAGAKVNGRMVTLDTPLKNGDIVEIITSKNSRPSLDWLNFVVTNSARNRIRQWYKRSHREENIARGREMLERELGKNGFEALLKSAPMQVTAERCNYHSADDLLAALGYGEVTLNLILNRLREAVKAQQPIAPDPQQVLLPAPTPVKALLAPSPSQSPINGVEGLLHHLAGCCTPVPGEPIIGVVTKSSRGISIHRQGCPNTEHIPGDRLVPVSWNPMTQDGRRPQTYPVDIQIEVIDRVGVLKDILSRLTDNNINVRNAQVKTFPDQTAVIDLGIDIRDHEQLERTFAQIKKLSDVLNLRRLSQTEN